MHIHYPVMLIAEQQKSKKKLTLLSEFHQAIRKLVSVLMHYVVDNLQ